MEASKLSRWLAGPLRPAEAGAGSAAGLVPRPWEVSLAPRWGDLGEVESPPRMERTEPGLSLGTVREQVSESTARSSIVDAGEPRVGTAAQGAPRRGVESEHLEASGRTGIERGVGVGAGRGEPGGQDRTGAGGMPGPRALATSGASLREPKSAVASALKAGERVAAMDALPAPRRFTASEEEPESSGAQPHMGTVAPPRVDSGPTSRNGRPEQQKPRAGTSEGQSPLTEARGPTPRAPELPRTVSLAGPRVARAIAWDNGALHESASQRVPPAHARKAPANPVPPSTPQVLEKLSRGEHAPHFDAERVTGPRTGEGDQQGPARALTHSEPSFHERAAPSPALSRPGPRAARAEQPEKGPLVERAGAERRKEQEPRGPGVPRSGAVSAPDMREQAEAAPAGRAFAVTKAPPEEVRSASPQGDPSRLATARTLGTEAARSEPTVQQRVLMPLAEVAREAPSSAVPGPMDANTPVTHAGQGVTGTSVTVASLMPRLERPLSSPSTLSRSEASLGEGAPGRQPSTANTAPARVMLTIGRIELRTRAPVPASPAAPVMARAHQVDPGLGPGLLQLGRQSW